MIRNKKLYLIISIVLISVVAIGCLGYLYIKRQYKNIAPNNELSNATSTDFKIRSFTFSNNEPDTIIKELKEKINNSSDIKFIDKTQIMKGQWFPKSQWWISKDDWNIIDRDVSSIISANSFSSTPYRYSKSPSKTVKELNKQISKIFLDNGFVLNEKNTSDWDDPKGFYDFITAFEKSETRCTLTLNRDFSVYAIVCSDNFQKAYDEQIPYLKALDIKNSAISMIERVGNFAKLDVRLRRTGHYTIVKIIDDKIEKVASGQEPPSCDLMEKNKVPLELYKNCFIDNTHLKY